MKRSSQTQIDVSSFFIISQLIVFGFLPFLTFN